MGVCSHARASTRTRCISIFSKNYRLYLILVSALSLFESFTGTKLQRVPNFIFRISTLPGRFLRFDFRCLGWRKRSVRQSAKRVKAHRRPRPCVWLEQPLVRLGSLPSERGPSVLAPSYPEREAKSILVNDRTASPSHYAPSYISPSPLASP